MLFFGICKYAKLGGCHVDDTSWMLLMFKKQNLKKLGDLGQPHLQSALVTDEVLHV